MKKSLIIAPMLIAAMVLGALVGLQSCSGSSDVKKAVRNALRNGDTTEQTLDSICNIIKADPREYSALLNNGEVNFEALQDMVDEIGGKMRPARHWTVAGTNAAANASLTIYFERSGSMVPYDSPMGGGQLKRAVNDIINDFPGQSDDNVSIKIVNSEINDYSGTIDSFLQDRNIYATTKGIGDASYTDFQAIFKSVLKAQQNQPGNVSVLITDMIYSPSNTEQVSREKIFNEEHSLAQALFKQYNNKSVIVKKMTGDYYGLYYPYNNQPFKYAGKRPFYVIVIANSATLDAMASNPDYTNFMTLLNEGESYRFDQRAQPLQYTVASGYRENVGRFRLSHTESGVLNRCEGDRNTGAFKVALTVDLSKFHKGTDFFEKTPLKVVSQSGFKASAKRIDMKTIDNDQRKNFEGRTHVITLEGKLGTSHEQVEISIPNAYPEWMRNANTDDDTNSAAPGFARTTFGLDHFMSGIYKAFSSGGGNDFFHITLTINRK